jgi:hypothetical protein
MNGSRQTQSLTAHQHYSGPSLRPVLKRSCSPDPLKSWRDRNSILAEAPHFFPCCCFKIQEGIITCDQGVASLHPVGRWSRNLPEYNGICSFEVHANQPTPPLQRLQSRRRLGKQHCRQQHDATRVADIIFLQFLQGFHSSTNYKLQVRAFKNLPQIFEYVQKT